MSSTRYRRWPIWLIVLLALLLVFGAAGIIYFAGLDPGSEGNTSSGLVTPTIEAEQARVFAVAPDESRVDFTANILGLTLDGVFPVEGGIITLVPEGDELRVVVSLDINVDAVETGREEINTILRDAMKTGDNLLAFYVATSRELVPVTEEVITFVLDGTLEVNGVPAAHAMDVEAQLVGGDMWAVATSNLELANHEVELPAFISGSTTITLTARLQAYETEGLDALSPATPEG